MTRKSKIRLLLCVLLMALPSVTCGTTDESQRQADAEATRRAYTESHPWVP